MTGSATCRSCDAMIEWTFTAKGRRMPIDPVPVTDGNIVKTGVILAGKDAGTATTVTLTNAEIEAITRGELVLWGDGKRFVSHFKTCPAAGQHRKARR